MTIRRPTSEELRRLGEVNHFQISDEEMSAFERMIPGLFDSYDKLGADAGGEISGSLYQPRFRIAA